MTLFDVTLVLQVAQTLSFSEAAFAVNLSQSALSKHIAQVETELGTRLFDRSTRTIRMTAAGELFVQYGKLITESYRAMTTAIQSLERDSIRIGMISKAYNARVSQSFAQFFNSYPRVSLELLQGNTSQLIAMLEDGTVDVVFGVVRNDISDNPNLSIYPLAQDELVLVVSCGHPLSGEEWAPISALANENFIGLDASSSTNLILRHLCERNRFTPRILHSCANPEIVLDFVCKGIGVAVLAKRIVLELAGNMPGLRWLHLQPATYRTVAIITKNTSLKNSNILEFIQCVLTCNEATPFFESTSDR